MALPIAWYNAGTITATNNSTAVTGAGTAWLSNVVPGEGLLINGVVYEIATVVSDTSLTLARVFAGTTASGLLYSIIPTQGYVRNLALQAGTLINEYQTVFETSASGKFEDSAAGIAGIGFTANPGLGLKRTGNNTMDVLADGQAQASVSTAGVSMRDGKWTLEQTTTPAKKMRFVIPDAAPSATTNLTLPAAAGTLATLAGTETLENKTLTNPVINGGTINGTTVPTSKTLVTTADAQTLLAKTLTSPVITSPTGLVKADVGLGNVDNTSNVTERAAIATLANKTLTDPAITDPTIDSVKYWVTQSNLTYLLSYALDQAGAANKRVSDVTQYQTQTGVATFTQAASTELIRTYATATVNLPRGYLNTDYQVVLEPVSAAPALGWQGEITVQSRNLNSFVLQMSGSATACSVRWKTLHPNAENRVHVVNPTAQ
jgi:hypothetical protein